MFDELFNELKEHYAGKFDWADIRGDQAPSLEALGEALKKDHPLYGRERAAALARRASSGDVLYLLEDGRYVILNPFRLNYSQTGFAFFYEFADLRRVFQHIRDEYAEEYLQESLQEDEQELAEIWRERKRTERKFSAPKFWLLYFAAMLAAYYAAMLAVHWIFTQVWSRMDAQIFSFQRYTPLQYIWYLLFPQFYGDRLGEDIQRIGIFLGSFAVLRAAGYLLERFLGVLIFEYKPFIITVLGGVTIWAVIHSAAVIPTPDFVYNEFFLKYMPIYLSIVLNYIGLLAYTHSQWLRMKAKG